MPAPTASRRRSRREIEDEQSESNLSDSGGSQSSSGSRKRARLSNDNSLTTPDHESENGNDHETLSSQFQRETLQAQHTPRKHQPGSIVRVKLANFVTYTAVEFFPGPSLNMVIGPNGTGKSTLVCAICLGLGWGPQHLGRAKEVSEFVKHGSQEATIEIELAKDDKKYKKNLVIGSTIKREGNKTVFSINGKVQPKKNVLDVARSLSIQIDNLCQFLPQDKVVEFAAMTPVELLKSTERAVASERMIEIHEELKKLRGKEKQVQVNASSDRDTLNNLLGRQRLQEADVVRLREREEIVKRVSLLETARSTVQYRTIRTQVLAQKQKSKAAQSEFNALAAETEPALRAVNAKQQYRNQIDVVVKERKIIKDQAEKTADQIDRQFQHLQTENVELENKIQAERDGAKKFKSEALQLEGKIREHKISLKNAPPEFDALEFNERLRALAREKNSIEMEVQNLQTQQRELTGQGKDINRQIHDATETVREFDSATGKQTAKLKTLYPESHSLWCWVQEHQDAFEKPVFGPPIVEGTIKDPRCVDQVESLFQASLWSTFSVQTKADFKTLSDVAHDRLHLNSINIETVLVGLANYQPPCGEDEKRQYGLEGWAVDYINAPEPVLSMLCGKIKLHETGVTMRDISSQQFEMLSRSRIQTWVTKKTSYRITRRREYGPSATSTMTRNVRPASIWTDQPVDHGAKRELQEKVNEMNEQLQGLKEQVTSLQRQIEEKRTAMSTIQDQSHELSAEKREKQEAASKFSGLPVLIKSNEEKLARRHENLSAIGGRVQEHVDKQDKIAMDRAELALKYADAVESLRKAHEALHEAELMLIEATSDFQTLEARNRDVRDLMKVKDDELKEIQHESKRLTVLGKRAMAEIQQLLLKDEDGSMRAFFTNLPQDQTSEELEAEIQSEHARLELMHEGNGNTIREYEQRQKKIESLQQRVDQIEEGLQQLQSEISLLREEWEPQLDQLIKRISDSFTDNMNQISCAGEVVIDKDEDFEQWSIQIRVKFRENEPLSALNSHRQSGGERAVSTIFYLMSLQSLTPSPFRVVDEINQGMDPRNERLVHKRMVDIACGNASAASAPGIEDGEEGRQGSQYFLITPKLLSDLSYARGMQVMCIASGEYMPEDRTKVDFKACVHRWKGLQGLNDGGGAGGRGMDALVNGRERVGVAAG